MIHFYSTRNLPAITDVRDSISGGGGSVCGSDVGGVVGAAVGHVVGAAAMNKAMDVSSDNLQRHLQGRSSCIMSDNSPSKMDSKLFQEYTTTYPSPTVYVSFKERTVEVEEALMKPTTTLSKIVVD